MKNGDLLNKPNQLIGLITDEKITVIQRKIYNIFLLVAQQEVKFNNPDMKIETNRTYEFEIDYLDAHSLAGIEHKDLKYIEEQIEKIMKILVEVRSKDNPDNWEKFNLLPKIEKKGCKYIFQLQGKIVKELKKQNYYTTLYLMIIQGLSSQYSIALYELAIRYKNYKIPKMTVEEFRKITNTQDQYNRFYDLRRYVLGPACEEISEKTNINLSYETEKRGRKIAYINFKTEIKEDITLGEKNELDDYDKQVSNAIKRLKKK